MSASHTGGQDFLDVVDGLEPVRLRRPGASGERLLQRAKRRAVGVREADTSGGAYRRGDVHWHLHRHELAEPPALGWQLIDRRGARWTILAVDQMAHDSRWRCHCRNLALAAGLDRYVTIQVATLKKDTAGAAVAHWSDWRSGIPACIQPVQAVRREADHREAQEAIYRVTIELDEEPRELANYRVIGPDGRRFEILGYEQANRIDALPVFRVREQH